MIAAPPEVVLFTHGASTWSIAVHGGAGANAAPTAPAGCAEAAAVGGAILAAGGSALDAVQRAVEILEDNPLFNAGTGACLDTNGEIALDAAIMDGATLRGGGVCALPPFKNPIAIARVVMEKTRHVLLAGEGAARFAIAHGFAPADPATMITETARVRLADAKRRASKSGGTVGAVARDAQGHVAAATSTGGMVDKLAGRVGDSPILGAGTYADDEAGACSTTGDGEAMIRIAFAKTAVAHGGDDALRATLARMRTRTAGTGGALLITRDGAISIARSTSSMSWAVVHPNDRAHGS